MLEPVFVLQKNETVKSGKKKILFYEGTQLIKLFVIDYFFPTLVT